MDRDFFIASRGLESDDSYSSRLAQWDSHSSSHGGDVDALPPCKDLAIQRATERQRQRQGQRLSAPQETTRVADSSITRIANMLRRGVIVQDSDSDVGSDGDAGSDGSTDVATDAEGDPPFWQHSDAEVYDTEDFFYDLSVSSDIGLPSSPSPSHSPSPPPAPPSTPPPRFPEDDNYVTATTPAWDHDHDGGGGGGGGAELLNEQTLDDILSFVSQCNGHQTFPPMDADAAPSAVAEAESEYLASQRLNPRRSPSFSPSTPGGGRSPTQPRRGVRVAAGVGDVGRRGRGAAGGAGGAGRGAEARGQREMDGMLLWTVGRKPRGQGGARAASQTTTTRPRLRDAAAAAPASLLPRAAPGTRPKVAAPKTPAPRTPAPRTPAPKTPGPKTSFPKTPGPKTSAPKTFVPEAPSPGGIRWGVEPRPQRGPGAAGDTRSRPRPRLPPLPPRRPFR